MWLTFSPMVSEVASLIFVIVYRVKGKTALIANIIMASLDRKIMEEKIEKRVEELGFELEEAICGK